MARRAGEGDLSTAARLPEEATPPGAKALPTPPEPAFCKTLALANLARIDFARPSARMLIERVAAWHPGVSIDDILGPSRQRKIVAARADAIAAVYRNCRHVDGSRYSLPETAKKFGGRDHTTILHALRKLGIATAIPGRPAQDGRRRG